jgi:hypothetical protein
MTMHTDDIDGPVCCVCKQPNDELASLLWQSTQNHRGEALN